MNNYLWSKEEDDLLKKLWDNPDIDLDDMAKALKLRSKGAIKVRAKAIGLPPHGEMVKDRIDFEYLKNLGVVIEG